MISEEHDGIDLWKTGTFLNNEGKQCFVCRGEENVKTGHGWRLCVNCHDTRRIKVIRNGNGSAEYISQYSVFSGPA